MKLKRGILLTALTLIMISILGAFSGVYASTTSGSIVREPITLGIRMIRNTSYNYGYKLNDAKPIWKISKASDSKNETYYCLRGGGGFGYGDMRDATSTATKTYSKYFDMKKTSTISTEYQKTIESIYGNQNYNKLMWVLEQCYVPAKNGAGTDDINAANNAKTALLSAVDTFAAKNDVVYSNPAAGDLDGYPKLSQYLRDEDIDAVQQLAIWHFTNGQGSGNDTAYDAGENNVNMYLGFNDSSYFSLGGTGFNYDQSRYNAMSALYHYLIDEAPANYNYQTTGNTSSPVEIATNTNIVVEKSGDRLIIGPYKINELRDITYTLEGQFTDGNGTPITDVVFYNNDKTTRRDDISLDNNKKTFSIKNLVGQQFYVSVPDTTSVKLSIDGTYFDTTITYWSETILSDEDETLTNQKQPVVQIEKGDLTFHDEKEVQKEVEPEFDLALRKFITTLNGVTLTGTDSREPQISSTTENNELEKLGNKVATGCNNTTARKDHPKTALPVETGYKVVYTIRVYNEGEVDGYATEITDYLPTGLKFIPATESTINAAYGWTSTDGRTIKTSYTNNKLLPAFDKTSTNTGKITLANGAVNDRGLCYIDVQIECEVIATKGAATTQLKNVATITGHKDINNKVGENLTDRDSVPTELTTSQVNNYGNTANYYQDDDDFELLELPRAKQFDLSLRKFITSIQRGDSTKTYNRAPKVDVTPLVNETSTTALYNHVKEPIGVSYNDIVTYTIRVYNEGEIDGYVTEITDYLPKQLEFIIDDELNTKYGWEIVTGSNGRVVRTNITTPKPEDATAEDIKNATNRDLIYAEREDGTLLKKFNYKADGTLDYIDVQIRCKVKENIDLYEKITNIAEITGYTNSENAIDRDSTSDSLTKDNSKQADDMQNDNLPTDENLPEYSGRISNKSDLNDENYFYKGQQDDDDFEKLVLRRFDLALRKFITEVKNSDGSNVQTITNRAPVFSVEDGKYIYTHTKEPVEVANSNIVTYTLRIFNEGNVAGYASKVRDDIPEGLEFLPEDSTNTAFKWDMYKEDGTKTDDPSDASYIMTEFLKRNENGDDDNLIQAFDPSTMTMPAYKELKVAFKVKEPNTSDRIIINHAQIADHSDEEGKPIDDIDSEPNVWNEGEDDQDIEKIKVKYFDLSLKKWVTESIVTVNGKTTVTKSGHTGDENPEAPMKVEIPTSDINKTTVKFRFNIKVTNEGEIAGYAKELIDYIPEGLKFVAEDNPKWTQNEDGTVTTDQLKDSLLEPGDSMAVDIVLTWINSKDNMGEKVNWAEINKDENQYGSPDIDSTPGNNVKGEDDIDQAPVLLSPSTGSEQTYFTLALGCATILASGIVLIKKFVL